MTARTKGLRHTSGISRGLWIICLSSLLLAAGANLISPNRIPWAYDWEADPWIQAIASGYKPVSPTKASELLDNPSLFIADARSPQEYAIGSIPGAVSIPWQIAETFLANNSENLALDTPLLIYCSSSDCDAALVLSDFFKEWGYSDISILVSGFKGWMEHNGSIQQHLELMDSIDD